MLASGKISATNIKMFDAGRERLSLLRLTRLIRLGKS